MTEPSATAPGLHLAQCNIARLQAPIDTPETADDEMLIVNMSVWESVEAFTFRAVVEP